MKIKTGDKVEVIKGRDRGKTGKVLRAFPVEGRIVVEGINMVKKASRPRKQGEKGQLIDLPSKTRVENVQIICPSCNKRSRVGYQGEGKKKERYCKKCKSTV
jgi:large subunit ribosomal protein L24